VTDVSRETPPPPAEAAGVFGSRLPLVVRYAALLAGPGTVRGLIGPREAPRLWERHLLNCAVLTDATPPEASVADLGSGAGLPGLVVALRRPDLRVTLVEPLLRRTTFLDEVVADLELTNVEVVRSRAEQLHGRRKFDVVTSRALAPLDRLLGWSLPLTRLGGHVLAMKGAGAEAEVAAAAGVLRDLAGRSPEVLLLGVNELPHPTTAVRVEAGGSGRLTRTASAARGSGPRRRGSGKRR
jgi:16S rRNA (guanine527-N7)-methyltransferase